MLPLAGSFLLLSGIASLTYQVAWVRLLGLSMGSTSASISTVLSAFFLGMALGSYLAERLTKNRIDNLKIYIILEFLIGICGLVLLPVLLHLDYLMTALPMAGSNGIVKFLIAITLLSIPTMCMGATFPVMASIFIRRHTEIGLRVGQLYSLNTAGAVAGAALSGFVLIPHGGLDGAIYTAFALNMIIVALALYADKRFHLPPIERTVHQVIPNSILVPPADLSKHALIALFATGFVSIATQVGWTKYLAIFAGTTIYGFSAILTVFLFGIAIGAWVIKSRLEKIKHPENWMATGLILLALSLLLTRAGLSFIPPFYRALNHLHIPDIGIHFVKYIIIFSLLFIPTFLFGALFPLNIKIYCGNQLSNVRSHIGKAYALNTVASIFGALIAGFWIIPKYGTDKLLLGLSFIILIVALVFIYRISSMVIRNSLLVLLIVVALASQTLPSISYQKLIASVGYLYDVQARNDKDPEFLFLKEGKAGVISAVTYGDNIARLQNNGLNESLIHLTDPNVTLLAETLLGLVPYMLHEQPKSAFVVGFGGGITTRALSFTDIESIDVVELEPAVIQAGEAIVGGEIAVLQDPRVTLDFNDARNTLLVQNKNYDLIVAQPSHPWLAGAANVFTHQFWSIAKSRLNDSGIFAQWVNLFRMDATTLRAVLKAFYTSFPHGFSFANVHTGDLILFGSTKELIFDLDRMDKILAQPKIKAALDYHEVRSSSDILLYFALSRKEALYAAGKTPANSDTNILSETRLSALVKQPTGEEDPYAFLYANFNLDIIPYLPQNSPNNLYKLAQYYFDKNEILLAEKASKQLAKIDPVLSRSVEYERLWHIRDYDAMRVLYAKHTIWTDRVFQLHALLLAASGKFELAEKTISRIANLVLRRETYAQILYKSNKWTQLASLKPLSNEEKKWQLLALAKIDPKTAGRELLPLVSKKSANIEELRVLLEYYSMIGDQMAIDTYARDLIAAIDGQTEHLVKLAQDALEKGQETRTKLVIKMIRDINPNTTQLADLEKALSLKFKTNKNIKTSN